MWQHSRSRSTYDANKPIKIRSVISLALGIKINLPEYETVESDTRFGGTFSSGLKTKINIVVFWVRPPLWSSDQSFWLQIQRSPVRFPALPDFLRSSGPGAGSTHPLRITEELLQWKYSCSGSRKLRLTAVGIRWADHAWPSIRKIWH
jgi:hypothetical protein